MIGLKSSTGTDLLPWGQGSVVSPVGQLATLLAHSCNYFQVIRPILGRYCTVTKKSGVMTFSDFMITVIKDRGKRCQQGRLTGTESELNFIRKKY